LLGGAVRSVIWQAVIHGETASKANSRRLVTIDGRPASIKSDKALAWLRDAIRQIANKPPAPFEGDIGMDCRIYYASRRPDLDESLVMDMLQHAGVIRNDRSIREKHVFGYVDRRNPRVEIVLFRPKEIAA
jgi:Holliday junction resolvase RusA-like endonuclease